MPAPAPTSITVAGSKPRLRRLCDPHVPPRCVRRCHLRASRSTAAAVRPVGSPVSNSSSSETRSVPPPRSCLRPSIASSRTRLEAVERHHDHLVEPLEIPEQLCASRAARPTGRLRRSVDIDPLQVPALLRGVRGDPLGLLTDQLILARALEHLHQRVSGRHWPRVARPVHRGETLSARRGDQSCRQCARFTITCLMSV